MPCSIIFPQKKHQVVLSLAYMTTGALSLASFAVCAGGVSLGATRIIYPLSAQQVSLPIKNSDANNTFLIKSWVSNPDDSKSSDFVVTPPLFSISPKQENLMRVMYVGKPLPVDRETVFYFNSKAVPAIAKEKTKQNTLQLATQSTIKLFMRPDNLPSSSVDAPQSLRCKLAPGSVTVHNPSPYYITLVSFQVGSNALPITMVAPMSDKIVAFQGATGSVKFQTINDFGAFTPEQTCNIG